jgi:hypothetical protein
VSITFSRPSVPPLIQRYENYGNNLAGTECFPRGEIISSTVTGGTGILRLAYWTPADTTVPLAYAVMESGGTAAAATPTLIRIGIYTVATNGDLTLVADTPNDKLSMFAGTSTEYFNELSVPYAFIGGQRYAAGILVVTGVAAPTYNGKFVSTASNRARPPRVTGTVSGQADLPSSIAAGSIGTTAAWPYIAFVN